MIFSNRDTKKEIEKKWINLISDEEKLFYQSSHFLALEKAVKKLIECKEEKDNEKKCIEDCIIEVEYLYNQSVNEYNSSSYINFPSILAMISGGFIVYSFIFQMHSNETYNIEKFQDGFKLIIPNSSINIPIVFLFIVIILVNLSVTIMTINFKNKNKNVIYYKNLLKELNKIKNSRKSVKEKESKNSNNMEKESHAVEKDKKSKNPNYLINKNFGFNIIFYDIKKYLKKK